MSRPRAVCPKSSGLRHLRRRRRVAQGGKDQVSVQAAPPVVRDGWGRDCSRGHPAPKFGRRRWTSLDNILPLKRTRWASLDNILTLKRNPWTSLDMCFCSGMAPHLVTRAPGPTCGVPEDCAGTSSWLIRRSTGAREARQSRLSCDIHTHTPARKSSANFQLY